MSADKISTKICEILTPFKKIRSEKKSLPVPTYVIQIFLKF